MTDASAWRPISEALVGQVVQLRLRDSLGYYDMPGPYFLHDDGRWYQIDPPLQMSVRPTHFRPA